MPRLLLLIIPVIFFVYSCQQPMADTSAQTDTTDSLPQTASVNFQKLLSAYTDISFDTLHVFPDGGDSTVYKYAGRALDSNSIAILIKAPYPDYYYDNSYFA
jgi:hypothetical protein